MSKDSKAPKVPKLPKAPQRNPTPGSSDGQPSGNWKGLTLFLIASSILLLAFMAHRMQTTGSVKELTFKEFQTQLEEGQVKSVLLFAEPSTGMVHLEGELKPLGAVDGAEPVLVNGEPQGQKFKTFVVLSFQKNLDEILAKHGFSSIPQAYNNNPTWQILNFLLPFLLFILLMYFFFRQQIKMAGKSAFNFGKSKAKMMNKDKNKITFKDVAGVDEAKEEVSEIVEFLKDPKKFQRLGGRIPKGILMVGSPGTGKTLLAKAIAGEADVPFYGISGSDFVEMFVGVGASRVRDMFEQGRKSAPCLIFIDEIDAVGRSRGHGLGGGHDEREQTLNAMLVEMDGIDTQEGVIIIAATNRKDVLDPALLRPGRFDREVIISLPDVKGREQILRVHAKKVKHAENVDWAVIGRGTPGFSGAELANLINEAALLAARRGAEAIEMSDLEEARDKVRWGRERRSMAMTEEEKKNTAYHEAGHAILSVLLENTDPLHKVTIIPRGPSLGVTMSLPEKDAVSYYRKKMLDMMCMIMGGRVAEEVFLGDVCSGASMDIRQATMIARKMVCEWGMSEKLGMVNYGENDDYVFLGREISKSRSYSEATAQEIDSEVRGLVSEAHEKARSLISEHRDKVQAIALALMEYETLDGKQVEDIVRTGRMSNPPPKNVSPPATPLPDETLDAAPKPEKKKDDDGLLPGLQGAPAGA
ncbi:MAG: ATP-dependent metallopeptidase FtsH/Yme1/Tma family protein [Blastochloris sp.]|nr:ATP-dependent metallopeptidase FtsH/Yme1/Tma family protein [Blastochloris sp.]